MKKYFSFVLFLVLVVVAFIGTVAATPTIESTYMDEDGNDITTAQVGDTVEFFVGVYADPQDQTISNLRVDMTVSSDIKWDFDSYAVSWDGGNTWNDNDASVTIQSTDDQGWGDSAIWNIATLQNDQAVMFKVRGKVLSAGSESTTSNLVSLSEARQGSTIGTSAASLTVTEPSTEPEPETNTTTTTVGMQKTGSPVGFAALAIALISAGLIYTKKEL